MTRARRILEYAAALSERELSPVEKKRRSDRRYLVGGLAGLAAGGAMIKYAHHLATRPTPGLNALKHIGRHAKEYI